MHAVALLVAFAALGVDYGWQPTEKGDLEYIIQIEPSLLDSLRDGAEIVSTIHPDVRGIRRFRIRVGEGEVPRVGHTETEPENKAIAALPERPDQGRPADGEKPQGYYVPPPDFGGAAPGLAEPINRQTNPERNSATPAASRPTAPNPNDFSLPNFRFGDQQNDKSGDRRAPIESDNRLLNPPAFDPGSSNFRNSDDGNATPGEPPATGLPAGLRPIPNPGQNSLVPPPDRAIQNATATDDDLNRTMAAPASAVNDELAVEMQKPSLPKSAAATGDAPKPWLPLVFTSLALFASLGGNIYLGWIAFGAYQKYYAAIGR